MSIKVRRIGITVATALLLVPALAGAELPTTVEFSPSVTTKMPEYGEAEKGVLESAVVAAVGRATRKLPLAAGLTLKVTLEDVAPTRPTREQLAANPSMNPTDSHFLGGAGLAGELRDANGHVLTTVRHRYFPPSIALRSRSFDPWADARLAIDQFAIKLAAACRALPRS